MKRVLGLISFLLAIQFLSGCDTGTTSVEKSDEVRVSDAPRANEILVAIAITDSGRPLARVGGLRVSEIEGEDGLR